jgi:hypothetical protein
MPLPPSLLGSLELPRTLPVETARVRPPWPRRAVAFVLGWGRCLLGGAVLAMGVLPAVVVLGWLQRWTRWRVLYGWWRAGPLGGEGELEEIVEARLPAGADVPVRRPRWFLREAVARPEDRGPDGALRRVLHALATPVHSLGLNFKAGVQCLCATCLLVGPGVLLMESAWEHGWFVSFHKDYEQSAVGPTAGAVGIVVFVAAMLYVPLAQVHAAVVGEARAFFDFRVVFRLLRMRPLGNVMLALVYLLLGALLELLKTAPWQLSLYDEPEGVTADYRAMHRELVVYYLACCAVLFVTLLLTRALAARLYRLALRTALRRGALMKQQLPPELATWLERLGGVPEPRPRPGGLAGVGLSTFDRAYRLMAFVAVVLTWLFFVAKTYVGEFFNRHPDVGFFNHPQVQLPFFNFIPPALEKDARGEGGPRET